MYLTSFRDMLKGEVEDLNARINYFLHMSDYLFYYFENAIDASNQ